MASVAALLQATLSDVGHPHSRLLWDTCAIIRYWWSKYTHKMSEGGGGGGGAETQLYSHSQGAGVPRLERTEPNVQQVKLEDALR